MGAVTYAAPAVSTVVGGVGGGSVTYGAAGGSFGGASGTYTSTGSAGFVGGVGGGSVTYGAAGGSLGGAAVMGGTTQMTMPATISTGSAAGTFTEYAPTTTTTRETGAPVYISGASSEVMGSAVVNTVHQEQVVAGSVSQNVVEIPTVQEVVQVQEIPEVQTVERIEEVVQKVQRPVEQIVEQTVEVPKIIPQERVQQRTVEQVVDVPVALVSAVALRSR